MGFCGFLVIYGSFCVLFFDLQDSRRSNLHSCIRFKRLLHARNMTNILSPQVTACAPGTQAGELETVCTFHRGIAESLRLSGHFIMALQRA